MSGPFFPMPSPLPEANVEVYLPRIAFDRIAESDVQQAAKRLSYDGPLHWETSIHDLPSDIAADSLRLRCMVPEALVFLECFRALVDSASARQDDELVMACAEALTNLFDGLELALNKHD